VIIRGPFAAALLAVLFLSLAANVMIAGFALGRVVGPRPSDFDRMLAMGMRGFPPEIRRAVSDKARDGRNQFRKQLDDIQKARQRLYDAMRAEPLDRVALEQAFADLRRKTDTLQQSGQELVAGAVVDAPPDVRRHIAPRVWLP
jgi:uncharacterized membrane protein